jgi:polysaccharide pyruvyl transferase CsaB
MKYLLAGYYGMANLGDDILLYVTLLEVSKVDPDARFTIISQRPLTLPPSITVSVKPPARLRTVRELLKHDFWLFGGGGIIQDYNVGSLESLRKMYRLARIAKFLGKKIAMIGIGLGPLNTEGGQLTARRLLNLVDFLTVRDHDSAELASQLKLTPRLRVTGDLALLLDLAELSERIYPRKEIKTLGLSVLPLYADHNNNKLNYRIVEDFSWVIDKFLDESPHWSVKLFEFHGGSTLYSDAMVLSMLQSYSKHSTRVSYCRYDHDTFRILSEIKQCDAFVGMRLHSSILAYLFRIPFLMVSYHPKCSAFAKMIGYPMDRILSIHDLHNREHLYQSISRLANESRFFQPTVPVETAVKQARENFSLFQTWLSQVRSG